MPKEQQPGSEGPKITLPHDIRINEALHRKLAEYADRLEKGVGEISHEDLGWKAPEQIGRGDSFFKHAVLEALLRQGEIDTHQLSRDLDLKTAYELENFNRACTVIRGYVTDGGKTLSGGTGLK